MTQEFKELLLRDLSSRFPYGVKIHAKYTELGETIEVDGIVKMIDGDGVVGIEVIYDTSSAWTYVQIDNIKPYLFPLSSMTEEQKIFLRQQNWCIAISTSGIVETTVEGFDWLNKNHFDYRGLIQLGLALDATNLNIY